MTAVEWVKKELEKYGNPVVCEVLWEDFDSLVEQAKKMEKQQIIDALTYGNKSELMASQKMFAEQYYNETYGSKGSDEIKKAEEMGLYDKIELANPNDSIFTSSQTEISDEEIEKEAKQTFREHPNNPKEHTDWTYGKDVNFARKQKAFIKGAKWYREQLKKK